MYRNDGRTRPDLVCVETDGDDLLADKGNARKIRTITGNRGSRASGFRFACPANGFASRLWLRLAPFCGKAKSPRGKFALADWHGEVF